MHSIHGTRGVTFLHNGDYSGFVYFVTPAAHPDDPSFGRPFAGVEVSTTFAALARIIASTDPHAADSDVVTVPAVTRWDTTAPSTGFDGVPGSEEHLIWREKGAGEGTVTLPEGSDCQAELTLGDVRTVVGARVADERISYLEQAESAELCALGRDEEIARWARKP